MLIRLPAQPASSPAPLGVPATGVPSPSSSHQAAGQLLSFPLAKAKATNPHVVVAVNPLPAVDDDSQQALNALKTKVETTPQLAQNWLQLAQLHTLLHQPGPAFATLTQALKHHPLNPALLFTAGDAATAQGEFEQALRWYGRVAKLQPGNSQALFAIALTHEALNNLTQARHTYEHLITLDPDWLPAYHNLGFIYWQLGHYQRSIKLFRVLRRIKPQYWQGVLGLALAYDHAGYRRQAMRLYTWLNRTQPEAAQLTLLQERLIALHANLN